MPQLPGAMAEGATPEEVVANAQVVIANWIAAAGVVCLSYRVYGWAVFFLVVAALNLAGGSWYITIALSASART